MEISECCKLYEIVVELTSVLTIVDRFKLLMDENNFGSAIYKMKKVINLYLSKIKYICLI
jgi:hypothetical protein